MDKFYVSEIPETKSVLEYIKENSSFQEAVHDFQNLQDIHHPVMLLSDPLIPNRLADEAETILRDDVFRWQTQPGSVISGQFLCVKPHTNLSEQTTYYDPYSKAPSMKKNSIFDSYSFIHLRKDPTFYLFNKFFSQFQLLCLGSRISKLIPPSPSTLIRSHLDHSLFEEIRMNLTLSCSPGIYFEFQTANGPLQHNLVTGQIFVNFADRFVHEVKNTDPSTERTHLAFSLSPWIHFNFSEKYYFLNDFFGKLHPLDILHQKLYLQTSKGN